MRARSRPWSTPPAGWPSTPGTCFRAGAPLEDLAACLASVQVELDDADPEVVGTSFGDTRDHRRYPGEGSFDLTGFAEVVRGTGFTGPWGGEILSREHRALPLDVGPARARDAAPGVLRPVEPR